VDIGGGSGGDGQQSGGRSDPVEEKLVEMGFPEKWCRTAVEVTSSGSSSVISSGSGEGGVFENALTWILGNGDQLQAKDEQDEKEERDRAAAAATASTNDDAATAKEDATTTAAATTPGQEGAAKEKESEGSGAVVDRDPMAPVPCVAGYGWVTSTSGLDSIDVSQDLTVSVKPTSNGFPR